LIWSSSIPHHFAEPSFRNRDVALQRALRLLLKRVQHEYGIGKSGGVDHSLAPRVISDPDFLDALANRRHRFEVIGLQTTLHFVELIARVLSRFHRKIS
jgi:hypothetical protein